MTCQGPIYMAPCWETDGLLQSKDWCMITASKAITCVLLIQEGELPDGSLWCSNIKNDSVTYQHLMNWMLVIGTCWYRFFSRSFFQSTFPHLRLVGTLPGTHSLHRSLNWKLLKAALERTASMFVWAYWIWKCVCPILWMTLSIFPVSLHLTNKHQDWGYHIWTLDHDSSRPKASDCFYRRQAADGIKLVKKTKDKCGKTRVVPWLLRYDISLVKHSPLDVIYPNWQFWGWYQKGAGAKCCISVWVRYGHSKFDPEPRMSPSSPSLYPRLLCRGWWMGFVGWFAERQV